MRRTTAVGVPAGITCPVAGRDAITAHATVTKRPRTFIIGDPQDGSPEMPTGPSATHRLGLAPLRRAVPLRRLGEVDIRECRDRAGEEPDVVGGPREVFRPPGSLDADRFGELELEPLARDPAVRLLEIEEGAEGDLPPLRRVAGGGALEG